MDDRYFVVKAAACRFKELNLPHTWDLRLEVKFVCLQGALLRKMPEPSSNDSTMYDHLTLLVENMATAEEPRIWYIKLSEHLDEMIAAVKDKDGDTVV
ncbi:hypothetical protein [Geomonas agri]|uniref:hypothetical protein n=1 Tax=Geomonas agri TaxID=2873702 RepID=UPI001CD58BA5|nr:hypothetical protein [Geomonas agri]